MKCIIFILACISTVNLYSQNSIIGKWNVQIVETADFIYNNDLRKVIDSEKTASKYHIETIISDYKESYFEFTEAQQFYFVAVKDYISIHLYGSYSFIDDHTIALDVVNPSGQHLNKKAEFHFINDKLNLTIDSELGNPRKFTLTKSIQ